MQPRVIGHASQSGLRAAQTVAPKSINAWLKSKTCRWGSTARETSHRCAFIACAFGSPLPTKMR